MHDAPLCARVSAVHRGILALVILLGIPGASGYGNEADVLVAADDSSVVVCQLLVLANVLVILEMESGLGLVARARELPALPLQTTEAGSVAECRARVDTLRFIGATEEPTIVTGPAVLASSVVVTGARSDAQVCSTMVIVNSIVIGGTAFGAPSGTSHGVVRTIPLSSSATCDAAVGEVLMEGSA